MNDAQEGEKEEEEEEHEEDTLSPLLWQAVLF